jgi:hypothetical protein
VSEYIDIQPEPTDDSEVVCLITNLSFTPEDGWEEYASPEQGQEGSPLAQALFAVPGLAALTLDGSNIFITRAEDIEWHNLIEDVSDVLRDFFL